MDGERKYKQRGYQDDGHDALNRGDRPRQQQQGPRPPIDVTGPRLPPHGPNGDCRALLELFNDATDDGRNRRRLSEVQFGPSLL